MRITCEHCKSIIDTRYEKKCNNCGAPYSDNKEYNEYLKKEKEMKEQIHKVGSKMIDNTMKSFALGKFLIIMFSLIFVSMIIFSFVLIFDSNKKIEYHSSDRQIDSSIEVGFNEIAVSEKYDIKCDKVSAFNNDEKLFNKKENYNYYSFHIVFNNKVQVNLLSDFVLTYSDSDGNEDVISNREMLAMEEEQLDIVATKKGTYTGNITFGVPKYVNDIKIKYKDIVIIINNFKDKIE